MEIDTVFSSFFAGAIEALFIMGDGFFVSRSAQIAALTNRQRIPASFATGPMVEALLAEGEVIDHCVLGEPTSVGQVGDQLKIGRRGSLNATFIVEYLNMERIPIAARDLLDVWPRKIYFFPRSGKVMVKRLRKVNNDTIVLRERDYGARLFHTPVEGGAELFK